MVRSDLVPLSSQNVHFPTIEVTKQSKSVSVNGSSGTLPQQKMGPVFLEDIWRHKLELKGWSLEVSDRFQFCIAPSTLRSYNHILEKLYDFCLSRSCPFPPVSNKDLADFLYLIACQSQRPHSELRTATAAFGHIYKVQSLPNIADSYEIKMLICALVKSGTSRSMQRSKVMPSSSFHDLFLKWEDNNTLDIKALRLKAITLLTLTAMFRPSDIAPNAQTVDTDGVKKVVFTVDQVVFSDEDAKIHFFGIKNDAKRTGFEIVLPRASIVKLDPVQTLQDYI
ncbi:hypothetical protein ACF0H5_000444 [Mactra antiquata]